MTLLQHDTGGSPILDYAGPASRRSLRLPASSYITLQNDGNKLSITETLAGQANAIAALVFAGFVLLVVASVEVSMAEKWHRNLQPMLLLATMMVAEVIVGAMVINNTWRKTVLAVTPQELSVTFSAPFTGRTRFEYRSEAVAEVSVIDTEMVPGAPTVPEMEIRMWNSPPVRLFPGHRHSELQHLAAMIQRVQPPATAAGPSPDAPATPAP